MGTNTIMDAKMTLDIKAILEMKDKIISKYGPWHVNNVYLQDDVYTIDPTIVGDEIKLRRVVQCVLDHTGGMLPPKTRDVHNGETYWGSWGEEHWPGDSKEVKLARLGASLDNEYNFWLSRPSIYNLLSHVGFTSIYECNIPAEPKKPGDRF